MARANGRDQQHSDRRSPAQSVLNDLPQVPAAHLPEPRLESSGAARLRLSGEVLVCVSLSAAECRLERFLEMLLYTHINPFTITFSSSPQLNYTYLHTPPQRNLPRITHRFIHRPRVLHRHGVSAGASPESLLASGFAESPLFPPLDSVTQHSSSHDSFSLSEPLRQCR